MAGPSGATARLALPYPIPADTVDVPRDVQALAEDLDGTTSIAPPLVSTTLPINPVDGQECYYLASATNGIVWHLRYRAASGNAERWEFAGGEKLFVSFGTQNQSGPNGWNYPTTRVRVQVPLGGWYLVEYSTYVRALLAAATIGIGIASTAAAVTPAAESGLSNATMALNEWATLGGLGVVQRAAGEYVEMVYNPGASAGTNGVSLNASHLRMAPLRVL